MTIGFGTTLIGLINAAIGGAMLVIPILALDAGYIEWIIGCLALACITTYTAYLLVKHLGKAKNIKYLVLYHFKGDHTYTTLYNIVIWFSFMSAMIIYYKLFCIQIQGLFGAK
jgi:amino acid permease